MVQLSRGGPMSLRSKLVKAFASTLILLSLAAVSFADTIRLKDGSIIKGRITGFGSGKFTVVIGEGSRRKELTFSAAEVESILFDAPTGAPQLRSPSNQNASYKEPEQPVTKVIRNDETTKPDPPRTPGEKMKPIEWRVRVLADNTANGWTNTGWVVKKGQRIRITGDGKVSLGDGKTSPPSGVASIPDEQKLLKNVATGALIAVIGDDNNDFIYVGAEREFTATRDGALFLGINEGYLEDNSGSYSVKIEIIPDDGD